MILVVGDVITDQWFRLSRSGRCDPATDASIYRVDSCRMGVGGAGMVAAMTASLGAWTGFATVAPKHCFPCSLLRNLYDVAVVAVEQEGRVVPIKSRIPVGLRGVRLDCEDPSPVNDDATAALCRAVMSLHSSGVYDWCVVADYGKGVVTPRLARTLVGLFGRRLIVDPAPGRAWGRWTGAGVLKCNAKQADGRSPRELCERFDLEAAIVTHGASGAAWCCDGGSGRVNGRSALEVDATGCGDQFLAALAIGMARGAPFRSVIDTANMLASMQAERETIAPVRPSCLSELRGRDRDRCRETLGA